MELIRCGCGCNELIPAINKRREPARFKNGHAWRGRKRNPRFGKKAAHWKGGSYINSQGYLLVYKPDNHETDVRGYARQHRLIWQEFHKACLLKWASIHHKNGNRLDNKIENLDGMMKIEHDRMESTLDMSDRKCTVCGSDKTYVNPKGFSIWRRRRDDLTKWLCRQCHRHLYPEYRSTSKKDDSILKKKATSEYMIEGW